MRGMVRKRWDANRMYDKPCLFCNLLREIYVSKQNKVNPQARCVFWEKLREQNKTILSRKNATVQLQKKCCFVFWRHWRWKRGWVHTETHISNSYFVFSSIKKCVVFSVSVQTDVKGMWCRKWKAETVIVKPGIKSGGVPSWSMTQYLPLSDWLLHSGDSTTPAL